MVRKTHIGGCYTLERGCACIVTILFVNSVLSGCSKPPPTPVTGPPASAPKERAWEERWDKLLAEARREGTLVIYTTGSNEGAAFLTRAFRQKYGINIDIIVGRGDDLMAKIQKERQAGIHWADVLIMGGSTTALLIKPLNITVPIEPMLILPEVKDSSKWFEGRLPLQDKAGHGFGFELSPSGMSVINTDLVKKGEISGIRDFLNPKWKGWIVLNDPTISGTGNMFYQVVLNDRLLGMEKGRSYMRELAKSVAVVTRDHRQFMEWIARGKYPIGVGASNKVVSEFIEAGAPIEFLDAKEPRMVGPGWALLTVVKDAPHPNTAELFVNWLFTREVLSELVRIDQLSASRVDVSSEGIPPLLKPRPGDIMVTEEMQEGIGEMIRMAREDLAILFK